jgi:hypothetical protein
MAKYHGLHQDKSFKKSNSKMGWAKSSVGEQLLLPWLLTKRAYLAMRSIVPRDYQRRMRYYFDDYGCLRCGLHRGSHKSNGFCSRCCRLVAMRLNRCCERRRRPKQSRYAQNLLSKGREARALLKDLLGWKGPCPTPGSTKRWISKNPALETFDRLRD